MASDTVAVNVPPCLFSKWLKEIKLGYKKSKSIEGRGKKASTPKNIHTAEISLKALSFHANFPGFLWS